MTETKNWHALTTAELFQRLSTGTDGVHAAQVQSIRAHLGSNSLPPVRSRSSGLVFLDQFRSSLIYILLVATLVSMILGEWKDAIVILGVVLLNAIIGWRQELQSSEAVAKLLQLTPQLVLVERDGVEQEIPADELVVGDLVVVETGDSIPADGRWIEALNIRVNEAALTGESVPVSKQSEPLPLETDLGERRNMAWRGTLVVAGRGLFIVTSVGLNTRFGAIVATIQSRPPETTPFQRKIAAFARRLAVATLFLGLIIFFMGLARNLPFQEVFLLAVSMIVSIIPEGLPVVITVAMSYGLWAMAKRQAIVRKLVAVETLGAVTVVATDKTGTLTYGEMMTEKLWVDQQTFRFTGQGYNPAGDIMLGDQTIVDREHEGLSLALRIGALNNDGRFSLRSDGARQAIGDPTELALVVAADKAGWPKHELELAHPRVGEFPFDFKKKYMVTWHKLTAAETLVTMKGAPHEVLQHCRTRWTRSGPQPLGDAHKAQVMEIYERWAGEALRGLAVAQLVVPTNDAFDPSKAFGQFMFVGLFGLADSLRPEADDAIKRMHQAGIRVMMMTGDYQKTGIAIGQRLGLIASPRPEQLLDGGEVDRLDDRALRQRLHHARIGTRLTPDHKFRIAKLFKQEQHIVAMTGDGINDVPALLEADVGVAVGSSASDAAKESADIVLVDGNFESITAAIAEGRRIFRNIRRVIYYLLATSFGELLLIMTALVAGWTLPLLPTQILWLNFITGPFLAIALTREPMSPTVMRERPHDPRAPIVTAAMWHRILLTGTTIAGSALVVFAIARATDLPDEKKFALVLTSMVMAEMMNAIMARSSKTSVFRRWNANRAMGPAMLGVLLLHLTILYLPAAAAVFNIAPLSVGEWLLVFAASLPIMLVEEIRKWIIRRAYDARPRRSALV